LPTLRFPDSRRSTPRFSGGPSAQREDRPLEALVRFLREIVFIDFRRLAITDLSKN
jgi:hypothetical protein